MNYWQRDKFKHIPRTSSFVFVAVSYRSSKLRGSSESVRRRLFLRFWLIVSKESKHRKVWEAGKAVRLEEKSESILIRVLPINTAIRAVNHIRWVTYG